MLDFTVKSAKSFEKKMSVEKIDLSIALKRLHRMQLEEGDLGAAYWLSVSELLQEADTYRKRALEAEAKLAKIERLIAK